MLLMAALVAGTVSLTAAPAPAGTLRVAGVDLKKLFENYWRTKQANNNLQNQREEMLKERNAYTDRLKKADEEYRKLLEAANDQVISAEERNKRKKAAEEKLVELKQIEGATETFLRNAASTLQETEARMRNNIVKELREAIAAKAKVAGYTLVIDLSADTPVGTQVFLYAAIEDITDTLTAELNAKAPPGALDDRPRTNAPPPAGKSK
ncbi:OmpH family outer membrane protein [Fontisphaera persica]|uniref:OmpH family outer membrane protein n=1 Tax=Fontisphaera persica TaxID=2974023 RepID=UPI0024BF76D7|nr:OmpH family outer membrane protein [Fontisphaera persica]WCJ58895.1 OmpH family outer membrane protein [Fontisphaera persica]